MSRSMQPALPGALLAVAAALAACTPVRYDTVDLLFVIDNSNSTTDRENTLRGFRSLLDALRDGERGGELPDLQIGVVSTDLGAGSYSLPTCGASDGAKLLNLPRSPGCRPPRDPWIRYFLGTTNVDGGAADPVARVDEAFACIAELGTGGCGYEQPLEAARRALDPRLGLNPGFVRPGALLAVVFFTDEDDCSLARLELVDPADKNLGPLSSFRCVEYGLACDQPLRAAGVKTNCHPAQDWLQPVDSYRQYFSTRQPRHVLAALAGPVTSSVEVTSPDGKTWDMKPSCASGTGTAANAAPALRLEAVVSGVGGLFNEGLDAQGMPMAIDICASSYQGFYRLIGQRILAELHK